MRNKGPNKYPPGLNAKKVAKIIAYYNARQETDLAEDPDHQILHDPTTWIEVPNESRPQVKKLLARRGKPA